jgi:hypothetical protein
MASTTRLGPAAAMAMLLAVTACTAVPEPDPTRTNDAITEPVGLAPVTIDDEPLWTAEVDNIQRYELEFHDDVAVLMANPSGTGMDVTVFDATTGEERWHQGLGDLPGFDDGHRVETLNGGSVVAGAAGEKVVMVGYYAPDCVTEPCAADEQQSSERGVIGLDLRTGEHRWLAPLVLSTDPQSDRYEAVRHRTLRVAGGTQGGPVVAIGPFEAEDDQRNDAGAFTSVEVDPRDGAEVWSADEFIARIVHEKQVIGVTPLPLDDEWRYRPLDLGSPAVVHRLSGERLWPDDVDHPAVNLHGANPTHLFAGDLDDRIGSVIDVTDGSVTETIREIPEAALDPVSGLLVYRDRGNLDPIVTWQTGSEPQPLPSGRKVAPCMTGALSVWDGYITCTSVLQDRPVLTTLHDRSGTAVSDALPGRAVALTDEHYAGWNPDDGILSVYRRTT